ncbi:MAG: hypothetical protein ACP5U0_09995 [Caldisphaera sp.]
MSQMLTDKVKTELEINARNLQNNLSKLGIKVGYKILDDGMVLSVDLESLIGAIFQKYPNIYREYSIFNDRYLILEMR